MDTTRRGFIQSTAGLAALPAAPAMAGLPKVKFGKTEVTRLIIGSNPFYGYSHFNALMNSMMREWMTQDKRMEVLRRCEQAGINTWQLHYSNESWADFKRYRAEGGRMNWFMLADNELMKNLALIPEIAKHKPIGIAHHGGWTDRRFRDGEMDKVREFCKAVRDTGVMVGISTHNPGVVDSIESQNWDIDYYMTCMYRVSRTPEEARAQFGEANIGEIYMEKDPERMTRMVRVTKRPCLAFKVFGAGRRIDTPAQVEEALRYVITNIKPGDAMIVGMFPRYKDEITENANLVSRICQGA
jgi:hypothetical protein